MEPQAYKIIRNFITEEETSEIVKWFDKIEHDGRSNSYHMVELAKHLNGTSRMFDVSGTALTKQATAYQSGDDIVSIEIPSFIHTLIGRISSELGIPNDHVFFQAVDMNDGGLIRAHYDVGVDGYINYKCNISVLAEDYVFFVEKDAIDVKQSDLYCFEASLYKHWIEQKFTRRRVLLSFGFMIPYDILGRKADDPRIRLSKRITKYFLKK